MLIVAMVILTAVEIMLSDLEQRLGVDAKFGRKRVVERQ